MHHHEVTLYALKHCRASRETRKALTDAGVTFTEKDASTYENHKWTAGVLGHHRPPVVTVHRDGVLWVHWSGVKPATLADVTDTIKGAAA